MCFEFQADGAAAQTSSLTNMDLREKGHQGRKCIPQETPCDSEPCKQFAFWSALSP